MVTPGRQETSYLPGGSQVTIADCLRPWTVTRSGGSSRELAIAEDDSDISIRRKRPRRSASLCWSRPFHALNKRKNWEKGRGSENSARLRKKNGARYHTTLTRLRQNAVRHCHLRCWWHCGARRLGAGVQAATADCRADRGRLDRRARRLASDRAAAVEVSLC